jgi:hypothetical protein
MNLKQHNELIRMQLAKLQSQTRRSFLKGSAGLGASVFMAQMGLSGTAHASGQRLDFSRPPTSPLSPLPPQFAPRAKRVIYMHLAGGLSQLDLFDHKPELTKYDGKDCPDSFLEGKKFAFISGKPKLMGSLYPFKQHGESGAWMSDRLPHIAKHVDDICFIKSMHCDQFNHAPAQILMQTGSSQLGHASLGAWTTYGLGTENQNLPGYVVLGSGGAIPSGGKALWSSGYLPSVYQGVHCRSEGEPVLYLNNPKGVSRSARRNVLDLLKSLNNKDYGEFHDPENVTRAAQYEMAYRMQLEATDAFDIKKESKQMKERYGVTDGKASFAKNCLVARRLLERGTRFVQLFDYGWDSHGSRAANSLNFGFKDKCREVDQPVAALLSDLKSSGMLEDTLVVFTGEFGRTPMQENRNPNEQVFKGRDHQPSAFTTWVAGGGIKGGYSHGETDEFGLDIVKDPVSVQDFHATILYLLGFDHHALSYPFQGLDQRLTSVHKCRVVSQILA